MSSGESLIFQLLFQSIDGLAPLVQQFDLDPFTNMLFLF